MNKIGRFLLVFFLLSTVSAGSLRAQSALDGLSPAARAEIDKLTPPQREQLSRDLSKPQENDLLCTRWGCVGGTLSAAADYWQSPIDLLEFTSFGASAGLEAAAPVPTLQDYGVGAQLSASYGVYDWNGTSPYVDPDHHQEQQFYSVGLFRRPDPFGSWWQRWGVGATHDFSVDRYAGIYSDSFSLQQWRAKASYYVTQAQEVGLWSAWRQGTAYTFSGPGQLAYRAADQLNFFYKYALPGGGNLSVYAGPGVGGSIMYGGGGHPFRFTAGVGGLAPVCDHLALFGNASYASPEFSRSKASMPWRLPPTPCRRACAFIGAPTPASMPTRESAGCPICPLRTTAASSSSRTSCKEA
jgi:hypothetical protein